MVVRQHCPFPRPGAKSRSRSSLNNQEPITETSKSGINPALDRRVFYKLYHGKYININYILYHPDYETAYRCDVSKVENKNKLAIKDSEEIRKEEDFVNVETSYRKTRYIMLNHKFGEFFKERSKQDLKELKRLKKSIDKEEKRKDNIFKFNNIINKNLCETYEEKAFIKLLKGPFY